MEHLIKYYMEQSNKNFDHISQELKEVKAQLADLEKFKVSMIATSRTTSVIVSGVSGLVTLLVTAFFVPWFKSKLGGN